MLRAGDRSPDGDSAGTGDAPRFDDVIEVLDVVAGRKGSPAQRATLTPRLIELVERSRDRRLFLPLLRALKVASPTSRKAIARCLPVVNDPKHHADLCKLLRSSDANLRAAAAQVLGRVGGRTALQELGAGLAERGYPGRKEAIDAVVQLAGHRSIPVLVDALPVCATPDKLRIIRYLGDAHYMAADRVGALSALKRLIEDRDPTVSAAAIKAFCNLATEDEWFDHISPLIDSGSKPVVLAAIESLANYSSPRVVTVLHGRLRSAGKAVRLAVLETLLAIGDDRVLPVLVDALSHDDLPVRARAAEVLAELGARGKVEIARTVLWLLRSTDTGVRRMAVDIAQRARDPGSTLWPRLFELLRDEDWWVRERVADALISLAGARMLGHLVRLLDDPLPTVRMFAVDVIGRLGDPKALGVLVRTAMEDEDWWVRERAMDAIAALGDTRAAPYLARIIRQDPGMRIAALDALGRLKATSFAPMVSGLLGDPEPDIRMAALSCLDAMDDPSIADALMVVIEDTRADIRELARRLRTRWQAQLSVDIDGWGAGGQSPLDALLTRLAELEGDDLVLSPGQPPMIKRMGKVEPIGDRPLEPDALRAMLIPILTAHQIESLDARRDVDLSYEVSSTGTRFRANVFHQFRGLGVVFRIVRAEVPTVDQLGLPPVVADLGNLSHGLVLVGGATGSGKSTTLAAIIDRINRTSSRHVITLEDPIEFVHRRQQALVNQREIGTHTASFDDALRATLREDPDVILVGELRDLDTIAFAVTAAETGHLVLGTIHTVSAETTVDRLINIFPARRHEQVRSMLAGSLRAVVCQQLLPRADGSGRVLACEIMLNTDAIANMIRTGKAHQLGMVISTSAELGMQTMDGELLRLVEEGLITQETAWLKARDKRLFELAEDGTDPPTSSRSVAG
ncbi:MAG: PilT/PilU family type 4a pilus ATPase [Deltaproteobacteria bacterium]|nr:MAG: PilT/PilU family type 4a pilus ATPase [Deltaproteobacteria bacterium]